MSSAERPPAHPLAQGLRSIAALASVLDDTTIALMRGVGVQPPQETGGQRFVKTLRRWATIVDGGPSHGEKR